MDTAGQTAGQTACQEQAERRQGRVTSFHARKGWGYIECLDTQTSYFVHHSEIHPQYEEPICAGWKHSLYTGEYVEFTVGSNPHKPEKLCAQHVTGINSGPLLCDAGAWRILFYRNQIKKKRHSVTQELSGDQQESNETIEDRSGTIDNE